MIVEILGAKMLAPYVGTSHFVWTAQIAITLVALAVGYYAGGWMVDRSSRLGRLYWCILIAAFYLCLTVLMVEPLAYWCLKFRLALGSLLASSILFFVPLSLLAMVGPFFIRALTVSVTSVGGNVGRLTAISTLGSFAGTILIGYVLIPFLPNSMTMYLTAALLLAVSIGYFLGWARKDAAAPATAALVALVVGFGGSYLEQKPHFKRVEELARRNSDFGLLQVLQEKNGSRRYYLNDYLTQNTYDRIDKQSISMFTYMLHGLARAYTARIDHVLCIGLGVGIVPMEFAREGARVDVVEINPAVVPLARQYFDLQPERLNIFFGDGRYFVNCCSNRYDTVILDAFLGDSCPSHLMTREAFSGILRILKPGGTLVINTFADPDPGRDYMAASLDKTLRSVFPSLRIHNRGTGNTLFVASTQPSLTIVNRPDFARVHRSCLREVQAAFDSLRETDPAHGRVLTDDYNPVEFYDSANRERLRRDLAFSVRNL